MPDKVRFSPLITAAARPYLQLQQGRISDFRGAAWDRAYADQLHATVEAIAEFVPQPLGGILDVGAGMGGIDAALVHRFGTPETSVVILDGLTDEPVVKKADETYSNSAVALDFLRANGVGRPICLAYNPGDPISDDHTLPQVDLVLSVQAWCFHFEPRLYCKAAMAMSKPGARWILDVRNDRAHWAAYLFATPGLTPLAELPGFNDKYTRMVFGVDE